MRQIFDYRCENGHIEEQFVERGTVCRCKCGAESHRIISPVRCQLDPTSGDFPGATMKWIKEHERAGGQTGE